MTAAVLSIGTELTRGELTDTNATWLSDQLCAVGFEVFERVTVADELDRIAEALRRLGRVARLVVVTGGLGPTTDDLTSEAAARALGTTLVRDEVSLEKIRRRWESFGRPMPPSNEKQAMIPTGAEILPNSNGTAPGFAVRIEGARFFFMPGVPAEMKEMFRQSVLPAVAGLAPRTTHQVHLRTFGLPESQVGELLAGIEKEHPGITLGYRAHFPEIEVKVLARDRDEAAAQLLAERAATVVRERLGDVVYGEGDDTLPAAVGRLLRDRGLTLAIAESCTGGMVGAMITSAPGSSDYLLLDAVTYSNASKTKLLGVNSDILRAHGAVSAESAAAMAEGARRLVDADIAVSVTGIAGPGGATDDKPIGTAWFGLARKNQPTVTKHRRLPGDRERIRTLASYVALRMVSRSASGRDVEE